MFCFFCSIYSVREHYRSTAFWWWRSVTGNIILLGQIFIVFVLKSEIKGFITAFKRHFLKKSLDWVIMKYSYKVLHHWVSSFTSAHFSRQCPEFNFYPTLALLPLANIFVLFYFFLFLSHFSLFPLSLLYFSFPLSSLSFLGVWFIVVLLRKYHTHHHFTIFQDSVLVQSDHFQFSLS